MQRVPISGGAITTLAIGYEFSGMALDACRGYWVDISVDTVNWVSLAGGAMSTVASPESILVGPVVDDNAIYWASASGDILRVSKPSP
jgi:hypothetical protein